MILALVPSMFFRGVSPKLESRYCTFFKLSLKDEISSLGLSSDVNEIAHSAKVSGAHQCGVHIRCTNHFICSGRAYGTIGNPLPSPSLAKILTVG